MYPACNIYHCKRKVFHGQVILQPHEKTCCGHDKESCPACPVLELLIPAVSSKPRPFICSPEKVPPVLKEDGNVISTCDYFLFSSVYQGVVEDMSEGCSNPEACCNAMYHPTALVSTDYAHIELCNVCMGVFKGEPCRRQDEKRPEPS